MSAATNLDADAFMRKYLEHPTDTTARLVFADWLEETGEPHNAAWAHFIRLKAEADRYPHNSPTRHELDRHAGVYATQIRARLTVPAELFIGYPKSLLQLLPAPNITVSLARFAIPLEVVELMPESVARENLVLPLDVQERTLLAATTDPHSYDTTQKLEFILNRDIILIGAEREDVQEALDRHYGLTETEVVDSIQYISPEEHPTYPTFSVADVSLADGPIVRLVNLIIIQQAIDLHADRILITPELDGVPVRYRIDGTWIDRDYMPLRLLTPVTARLAFMVGIPVEWTSANPPSLTPMTGEFPLQVYNSHFGVRVTIQPSPDGPTTQIDLIRDPPPAF